MNALAKAPLHGEIIPPAASVSVYGTTHPLNVVANAQIRCRVQAGLSITEILMEALASKPGHVLRRDFIVKIGDHEIPEANWSKVRVKEGATVTFIPRLQGGGALRSILGLVVSIAALAFAGPIAGALGLTIAGFALTGTALSVTTALVAGGIILAGTLALNALFPTRPAATPDSVTATSLNSIQGAQNQANPFGPIPVVLGTHRQSPYYAAKPYTEIIGDDQYIRLLFCPGYGPMEMSDFKIGETPLSSFSYDWIEVNQGFVGDTPPTIYPGSVDEVALSVTLSNTVDPPGVNGGNGTWQSQTTAAETDEISLDFTATEGSYAVNTQTGNLDGYNIYVAIRYRLVGAGSWSDGGAVQINRSVNPARVGTLINVARGQYEVQARKLLGDANSEKVKDKVVWTALRSIKQAAPISFPKPLALVALRIKASDQLSGVINTFNCMCTSLVKAYSGSGSVWNDETASQNPADLFRHVLQGPANARPVADDLLDLTSLQGWWAYCATNGFKFNQVRNTVSSVSDALDDICAAGRGVKTFIDGKWGVIWDQPDASIVQHFTPRNSWGFQGQKPYTQQPHGWRVNFINEDNGYTQDERIVYDDGYDATNATLFEGIQFPGVTDPDLIWKHGRFHIAQSRLRPEKITINVGWEHLVCTRGDRVRVTHDVLLIGLASGRLKSVEGQVVTFDEVVTIEAGKTYGMQFRVPATGRTIDRAVDPSTVAGDYTSLTLVGDLSGLAAGNLFGFGEADQESADYRVQGITHQKDLIATLTLVDDAPDISTADSGIIPAYNPNVTIPADPFTLAPRDLKYLEVIDGTGASVRALVRLSWQVPRFGKIASFQVQQQDNDVGGAWTTVDSVPPPRTSTDVPLIAAGSWSFRVRCMFTDGTASDWATISGLSLLGLTFAPDDIVNLHQHSVDGQTVLDWNVVTDPRAIYYEVRKGSSWDTGLVVGDVVTQPPWATTGDGTFFVRAYVLSPFGTRIYSVATASITIADSIISRNIIVQKDEQGDGWPGTLDGGVIDGSNIRTDTGHTISLPVAAEVVSELALTGLHIAVYLSGVTVNIGRAAECRFWTEYEASGIKQGDDFLAQTDVLGSGDVLGTSPTRFILAFPIWRFAGDGVADVFAPSDVFDPADVFTAGIEFGDWVNIASGTRVSRYFQAGYVLITNDETTDATGTKFKWFVDVPDRNDDYTELSVPDTGLAVTFYSGGYDAAPIGGATAVPFNGGPNGSSVPHVQRAIINGTNGDEVKITNLTLAGCTVHVVNAGTNVTRAGVNLLVRGY
jgi:hypothetical protein